MDTKKFNFKNKKHFNPLWFKVSMVSLLIFLSLTIPVKATAVTTDAVTDISYDSATFHATIAGLGGTGGWMYFSYGGNSFIYSTPNFSVSNGAISYSISGMPLFSGVTYQVKAVVWDGTSTTEGNTVSFAITPITTIDDSDYNFTAHYNELVSAGLDIQSDVAVSAKPYTDVLGNVFWGILFGAIFGLIWLKQEDVTIPSLLGILIGSSLWAFMDNEWIAIAQSLLVVSIAGIVFTLLKPRGN